MGVSLRPQNEDRGDAYQSASSQDRPGSRPGSDSHNSGVWFCPSGIFLGLCARRASGSPSLAGNLPYMPSASGWTDIETEPRAPNPDAERSFHVRSVYLADGIRLAVGDDL